MVIQLLFQLLVLMHRYLLLIQMMVKFVLKNSANFEVKNSYSINVVATDNGSTPANSSKAITINVTDQNDVPVTVNDTSITTLNTVKNNIAVLANDSDEDGDTLTIQSVNYSGAGNATTNGTIINYTPPTGVLP